MNWKTMNKKFDHFFDFSEFEDFFQSVSMEKEFDVEKDGKYIKTLDCPGFNEKNLKIQRTDQTLTIKGETETRKYDKTYTINDQVTDISAVITDGVLTLTLTLITQPTENAAETIEIKTE